MLQTGEVIMFIGWIQVVKPYGVVDLLKVVVDDGIGYIDFGWMGPSSNRFFEPHKYFIRVKS